MTSAPRLLYPPGPVLAAWWQQLAPFRPRAVWVGHLVLHHLEAPARVRTSGPLDLTTRFLLQALHLAPSQTLAELDARLHLGRPVVARLLDGLRAQGLAERSAAGGWDATNAGRQGLEHGVCERSVDERRPFTFVEPEAPGAAPHFVSFSRPAAAAPWPVHDGWQFDPGALADCVARPSAWKEAHGFPADVEAVPTAAPDALPEDRWEHVFVDHPERLPVALVLTDDQLAGFAVREDGWVLQADRPLFTWPAADPPAGLADPFAADTWRPAWRALCSQHHVSPADADACPLAYADTRLSASLPYRLLDRLRPALQGDPWLLAGTGRLRPAARVELREA